jgi:hypothetical protein
LGYNRFMERDTSAVVFRYKLWIRLTFLLLLLILLGLAGWMGAISARMLTRLSDPFVMALAIPSVFVSLLILLVCALFGYAVLFYWTYRLEFGPAYLETRMIDYPFVRPFRCAYEHIARVRRGMARGRLEIVPCEGSPLRVGVRALEGPGEGLLDELLKRVGAERVQSDLEELLWEVAWFDRFRFAVTAIILASQSVLLGLTLGRGLLLSSGLSRRLSGWVLVATSLEARLALLSFGLVVVGVYVIVYVWRRRTWRSGGTRN